MYKVIETKQGWRVIDSKGEFVSIAQPENEARILADLFNRMK